MRSTGAAADGDIASVRTHVIAYNASPAQRKQIITFTSENRDFLCRLLINIPESSDTLYFGFPMLNALLRNQAIQLQYQNLVCNAMVLKHFSQLQPPKSPKIEVFALAGHDLLTHNSNVGFSKLL
jgi:hypothetical protein